MKTFPLLLLSLLIGCAKTPSAATTNPTTLVTFPVPAAPTHDANPAPPLFVTLSVYRLAVPAKSISHNEEFWKHVNEDDALDIGAHDRLFANGFRVGIAERGDWDYFKNILESDEVISQQSESSGVVASELKLLLRDKITQQYITWFHPTHGLIGQVYDRCENLVSIHFEALPKKIGSVRVSLTPVIRAERTELIYTIRDEIQELEFKQPEYFFDLKLAVDVPLDHFLLIAPSSDADLSTSLGRKFLYQESKGQEFEQILLISPQPFQFAKKPTTMPAK